MNILHLNTEKGWRGGENQIKLFIENTSDNPNITNHVACLNGEKAFEIFEKLCPVLALNSRFSYSLKEARKIAKYCQENNIDIVDAQTGRTHSLALLVKKLYPKVKIVVHRRVDNPIKKNFLTKHKYINDKITLFVGISKAISNILENYGIDKSKIATIRSAINPSPFHNLNKTEEKNIWARKLNVDEKKIWIGNASALSEQKAYDILIHAIKELSNSTENFHCLIAGEGPLEKDLKNLTKSLKIEDNITFLGFIKNTPSFLSALDILAVPSNNEGLGTIIQEGAYANCAVIAANVGGIPEMILHEKTGVLIERKDIHALSKGLLDLVSSKELREKYSQQLNSHIQENFSLEKMVSENISNYRKCLQQ